MLDALLVGRRHGFEQVGGCRPLVAIAGQDAKSFFDSRLVAVLQPVTIDGDGIEPCASRVGDHVIRRAAVEA